MPQSGIAEAAGAALGAAARQRSAAGNISTEEEEDDSGCSDNDDPPNKKGSASGSMAYSKNKAEPENLAVAKDMGKQATVWPGAQARDQSGPIPSVSSTLSNVTRGMLSSDILRNQTSNFGGELPSPSQLTQSSSGEGSSLRRPKPAHLTVQIPERNSTQYAAPSSTGLSSIPWLRNWSGSWTPTPQPTFTSAHIDNAIGRESMYLMSPHGFPTVLPSPSAATVSAQGTLGGSLLGKRMADTALMSANVTTPRKLQEFQA